MTLDQWLAIATDGLSQASIQRVRTEIAEHSASAREHGDDPVASLGDPKAANRAYRSVLLTEREEMLAPAITQTRPMNWSSILPGIILLGLPLAMTLRSKTGASNLPVLLAIGCVAPLSWFLPPNTVERNRVHIYAHLLRCILATSIAWNYQGWPGALILAPMLLAFDYALLWNRTNLLRKLQAHQTALPLPGEPYLSRPQAIFLRTMGKGVSGQAIAIAFNTVVIIAAAIYLPWTMAPSALVWVAHFASRFLPVYTEQRSAVYRPIKWTAMLLASILPFMWHAPFPHLGVCLWASVFFFIERQRIALRRKLPVGEWPPELYL